MLTNIILWIVFGGIAGWLASLIMGKDASMGAIANIVVGVIGAIIGGRAVAVHNHAVQLRLALGIREIVVARIEYRHP